MAIDIHVLQVICGAIAIIIAGAVLRRLLKLWQEWIRYLLNAEKFNK